MLVDGKPTHFIYDGDMSEVSKWVGFAKNLLLTCMNSGLPGRTVQVNSDVLVQVDDLGTIGKIYIKAGGCVSRFVGYLPNTSTNAVIVEVKGGNSKLLTSADYAGSYAPMPLQYFGNQGNHWLDDGTFSFGISPYSSYQGFYFNNRVLMDAQNIGQVWGAALTASRGNMGLAAPDARRLNVVVGRTQDGVAYLGSAAIWGRIVDTSPFLFNTHPQIVQLPQAWKASESELRQIIGIQSGTQPINPTLTPVYSTSGDRLVLGVQCTDLAVPVTGLVKRAIITVSGINIADWYPWTTPGYSDAITVTTAQEAYVNIHDQSTAVSQSEGDYDTIGAGSNSGSTTYSCSTSGNWLISSDFQGETKVDLAFQLNSYSHSGVSSGSASVSFSIPPPPPPYPYPKYTRFFSSDGSESLSIFASYDLKFMGVSICPTSTYSCSGGGSISYSGSERGIVNELSELGGPTEGNATGGASSSDSIVRDTWSVVQCDLRKGLFILRNTQSTSMTTRNGSTIYTVVPELGNSSVGTPCTIVTTVNTQDYYYFAWYIDGVVSRYLLKQVPSSFSDSGIGNWQVPITTLIDSAISACQPGCVNPRGPTSKCGWMYYDGSLYAKPGKDQTVPRIIPIGTKYGLTSFSSFDGEPPSLL